jgi:hypothetical protein
MMVRASDLFPSFLHFLFFLSLLLPALFYSHRLEITVVDGGRRAVIFDKIRGIQTEVVSEGTHFRIPLIQV